MEKRKLRLDEINVESFITSVEGMNFQGASNGYQDACSETGGCVENTGDTGAGEPWEGPGGGGGGGGYTTPYPCGLGGGGGQAGPVWTQAATCAATCGYTCAATCGGTCGNATNCGCGYTAYATCGCAPQTAQYTGCYC